jgi:phosphatidylserine/phosphatidylglycerophosphate/cardiolipin synthase-like enzyme
VRIRTWLSILLVGALAGCGHGNSPLARSAQATRAGVRAQAPGTVSLLVQPQDGAAPIVAAIDGATASVCLEIYMLTDASVIDALARAAARGIDVRVLIEENPYNPGNPNGGLNTNKVTAAALQQRGVTVAFTSPTFNFTHAKTMLVDGRTAYVLTYNLTKAAAEDNREFGVVCRDPGDVAELAKIFEADWARVPYRALDPDVVVSPENARWRIFGLMDAAQRELWVGVESLTDPEAVALLKAKHKAGVDVRVLVGNVKKMSSNLPPARELMAAGVPVRSQGRPYLHAKYAIADGQGAYVGSINLSTNSLDENRELGLILDDGATIARLHDTFAGDWEAAQPIQ